MAEYTIFGSGSFSAGIHPNNNGEIDSTEFYVTSPCWVTALRYYRGTTTIGGTITGTLWRVDSATTGTQITAARGDFSTSGTGWITRTLPEPIELTVNQRYRAAIRWGTNRHASTDTDYWTRPTNVVNGPLVAPNNANAVSRGTNGGTYTSMAATGGNINTYPTIWVTYAYPIDVVVADVNPNGTPATQFLPFFA